ncbi:MAG: phosphatase PAP2 family protein [Bacteroidetes bacterium]|nr:phosphatase PAP2 family protein [Bacteroidota bacterium]
MKIVFLKPLLVMVFILGLIRENPAHCQTQNPPTTFNGKFILNGLKDGIMLPIQPIKWNAAQWITAGAVVGVVPVLVYNTDNPIRNLAMRNQHPDILNAATYGSNHFGTGLYPGILFTGIYAYGAFTKNDKAKEVALLGAESLGISAVYVTVLKQIFKRERPYQTVAQYQTANPFIWEGPFSKNYTHVSFPSGHTITAFACASLIAHEYKDKKAIPIIAYSVAALTGLGRIYLDKHWSSDVFMGAALGVGVGAFVYHRYHKVQPKSLPQTF